MHGKKLFNRFLISNIQTIKTITKIFGKNSLGFVTLVLCSLSLCGCSSVILFGILSSSSKMINNQHTKYEKDTLTQNNRNNFIKSKISYQIQEISPSFFEKASIEYEKNTLYIYGEISKEDYSNILSIAKNSTKIKKVANKANIVDTK
jgi:predicted PurR-regulated permease PerM